jgi:hypothetical protein
MVWLFALLIIIGIVLSVPIWEGVTGGRMARSVGIPLAVIGVIGVIWELLLSLLGFDSLVSYAETLGLLYAWVLLAAVAFAIGEAVFRKRPPTPPAPETSANHPAS